MSQTRQERVERGLAARTDAPRSAHRDWTARPAPRDPIDILEATGATRLPELLPIRYGRMMASPFAFFRGGAAIMAADLAGSPASGLRVQACGDAHISNFGKFATPERRVVFDINDFDETLPGAWEWDVKRLAASIDIVARGRFSDPAIRHDIVASAIRTYRQWMASCADLPTLDLWYSRIDVDDVIAHFPRRYRPLVERDVRRARRKTHRRAVAKLTEVVDGHRRFIEAPPLIVRLVRTEHDMDEAFGLLEGYRASLSEDRREVLDRFELVDVVRKVVGVGSVGTRCWIALFEGPGKPDGDTMILQVKEAGPSVLAPYMGPTELEHDGRRVVVGQRLTQSASDMLLGWSDGPESGRHYYIRQLWDTKGQGDPEIMDRSHLAHYGALCATALARAHARTGDPVAISAYLGTGGSFERAIADFAARYADQTEFDHAALVEAVRTGRLEARPGI